MTDTNHFEIWDNQQPQPDLREGGLTMLDNNSLEYWRDLGNPELPFVLTKGGISPMPHYLNAGPFWQIA